MNPIIRLGTNVDSLSLKPEDNDKDLKSELNNELVSMDFFNLLNAYFNFQPPQEKDQPLSLLQKDQSLSLLQKDQPLLLQKNEKIELNKNENTLVNDEKNEKIMSLINQINLLENLNSVASPQQDIKIPNQEKNSVNIDVKNEKIMSLINVINSLEKLEKNNADINNIIPDKLEIFQDLDKYFKQENKPIYRNNIETIVEKLQNDIFPDIGLKQDEFPLLQKNLVINKPKIDNINRLSVAVPVYMDMGMNMNEDIAVNNKKNELILAELKSLPSSEQTKIIQTLILEKNSYPEIKNDFNKKTELILTDLQSQPLKEQLKILQSLVVSKVENQNIPIFARELIQDNMKSDFKGDMKEDKKDDDRLESTTIFGNNGEKISHSEMKHSDGNHANILPTKDIASKTIAKAMDLVDQLKATQGGTAKFQIQDSQLGKIDLKIEMKNMNSITVSVQTEHTDVKKNIEDKIDSLKQSLDEQKITLTDFKVTIIDKPSNTQTQFSNSSHQEQQNSYQNLQFQNSFNQNSKNENNNLVQDEMNINNNYKKVQKNTITNIQRGANGSIKVLA